MTQERNELIAEMWEVSGLSSTEIAKSLGVTRGTVMGVIHRFKEKGRVFHRVAKKVVTVAQPQEEVKPMVKKPRPIEPKIKVHKLAPIPAPLPKPPKLDGGITIFELTPKSCRYILGPVNGENTRYCGEPKTGKSYCRQHRALCYYTLKPRSDASHDVGDTKGIGDGATRTAS
jgi:hypothetical protein